MALRRDLLRYVAVRLALAPVMLWIIASLVFLLLRVAPGDPVDALLGLRATPAAREALRVQLGLNQPLAVQYFTYLQDLVHGHLGTSLASQEAVGRIIRASLPATIELGCTGLLLGAVLG
ncbi:MAG: ABC transporter permease, partial [Synechococcus sp. SB0672_bin_6]|nr:ABC transporter permease [Synechococcus sp. SB0672_bin_6]